ncbi:MAG: oligosaccharide flippase family protein, partial [Candidatus Caldarchaeum sp.]
MRRKALEGSIYLSIRRAVGIFLSIIGLLFITRAVGPAAYGLFAAASSLFGYAQYVGCAGIRAYLIRETRDNSIDIFHQSFTLSCLWGFLVTSISLFILFISSTIWKDFYNLALISAWLLMMLLPVAVSEVPMAIIEYRLEYKKISLIELLAQIMFYIVGIPLAQLGAGVWALVSAFWVMQIVSVVGIFWAAEYRPRWEWNTPQFRTIFKESLKIGFAQWIYELRQLTTPLVLLPLTNETTVGYYALAERLRSMLDILRVSIGRLSLPLYARAKTQPIKLLELVRLSSLAQLISVAILYIPALFFGEKVLAHLFNEKWDVPLIFLTLAIIGANQLFFVIFGALNQALLVVRQA